METLKIRTSSRGQRNKEKKKNNPQNIPKTKDKETSNTSKDLYISTSTMGQKQELEETSKPLKAAIFPLERAPPMPYSWAIVRGSLLMDALKIDGVEVSLILATLYDVDKTKVLDDIVKERS